LQGEHRRANWVLRKLPRRHFTSKTFLDLAKASNDFVSFHMIVATRKRKACEEEAMLRDETFASSKQCNVEWHQSPPSVTRPAPPVEIACPPVAQIAPQKEVVSIQTCHAWAGDQHEPLFPLCCNGCTTNARAWDCVRLHEDQRRK
jgi:hypothetical protein